MKNGILTEKQQKHKMPEGRSGCALNSVIFPLDYC
jgi:hypothetical protein